MWVPARTVYPYSIIPGGAWSRAELTSALERDPVAAEHYRGLRAEAAHMERMPGARAVYVSFRKNDKVYWTRHTVTLAAGEAVLSDGENLARARCGNRISLTPQQPTGPEVDLDTPEPAPTPGAKGESQPPDAFHLPLLVHDLFPPLSLEPAAESALGGGPASSPSIGFPAWFGGGGGGAPAPEGPAVASAPQSAAQPRPGGPATGEPFPSGDLAIVPPPAPLAFPVGTTAPAGGLVAGLGGMALPGGGIRPVIATSGNLAPQSDGGTRSAGISAGGEGGPDGGGDTPPPAGPPPGGGTTPDGPGDTPWPPGGPVPHVQTPPDGPPTDTPEPAAIWLVAAGAGVLAIRRAMR